MKLRLFIFPIVVALCFGCVGVEPIGGGEAEAQDEPVPEPEPEVFTLDGVPTLRVSTLGGAEIAHRSSYTMGASCVLEYSETSSLTGESVPRSVDFGGFSIKGRGNSTWGYPKKPYLMKFDLRQEVLWMGKGKTWCLLANWMDRTLLRNDVAFEIASRCEGLDWTPKGEFVELVLNGKDVGLYYLCPHISLGKDRVDAGDEGIIFELDTYYDEPYKFYSKEGLPVMIKDFETDGDGSEAGDYLPNDRYESVKSRFLTAEVNLITGKQCQTGKYLDYFDLDSMVDFYLLNEVVGNGELMHPKSTYMYFNAADGKYYFGPVWDFDWGTMMSGVFGLINKNTLWYKYLFYDPLFVRTLKERWAVLKASIADIEDYISDRADWISAMEASNSMMWPITSSSVNGDERLSFSQAVSRLKSSLQARISSIDQTLSIL